MQSMSTSNPTDDTDDEQTYEHVTSLDAADADTQSLLLGEHREPIEAREPEERADDTIAYVRRTYEPVAVVDLPQAMDAESARAWVDANREHAAFADYDWAAHDRRDLLGAVVETRSTYVQVIERTFRQLDEVPVVSVQADEALAAVQGDLADIIDGSPPRVIDETGEADDGDEQFDASRTVPEVDDGN